MGYIEGKLEPREICTTELVWVAADPAARDYDLPDTSDLGAPGTRVYFGDVEFMGPYDGPPPQSAVILPPAHWEATPTPIPSAGLMFLGVAAIALAVTVWKAIKES